MKKYVVIAALFVTYWCLPYVTVPVVYFLYGDRFYRQVDASLTQIAQGKPYCIIVPRINSAGKHASREWVVSKDPETIDLRHILDHAIREKLLLAREGRSLKRRAEVGREMHFGLSLKNEFYIWSFRSESFVKLPVDGLANYERSLINVYLALQQQRQASNILTPLNINDYYCSHLAVRLRSGP